ncbi:hypothetical protein AWZ03_011655 [Drosophila navojoa]|uniref:RRM domain-containing protein n=2 Tax=Drosophila navojoa TaxID=7232 RepID=A0A484AZ90_DRONA|nr:hypothetical protein AWZ03_011655 [Drosophila navojoa]
MSEVRYRPFYGRTIAYTEDNIEIRKLFVHALPIEMELEVLSNYFNSFGRVLQMELTEKATDRRFKYGYVLYESSRDAADVLLKERHLVEEQLVKVEAFYSWGQPASVERCGSICQMSPIMRLNDDCLLCIYRYLALADQLSLARVLQRCPPLYSSINLGIFKGLSLWHIRDFLLLFGQHLSQLVGQIPRNHHQRLIEYLANHCQRLKVLRLRYSPLSLRNMRKLFGQLQQLEELELSNCDLSDESLLALSHLTKLKALNLCYNDMLTGRHMDKLPSSIESLDLLYCFDLQFALLPSICSRLPKLRELSVKAVHTEQTDVFRALANEHCCERLERLALKTLSYQEQPLHLEYVAKLPALRQLIIHDSPPSLELLQWLVTYKAQQLIQLESSSRISLDARQLELVAQLKALRILSLPHHNQLDDEGMAKLCSLQDLREISLQSCKRVTEQAILRLLLSCKQLHVLHLERCVLLFGQLIYSIESELREELHSGCHQRQLPVQLFFYGSKINEFVLKHPDLAGNDVVHVELTLCPNW